MTTPEKSLGGRPPRLAPAGLPSDQHRPHAELVKKMVSWAKASGFQADTATGELIGPFNPMLRSPRISHAMLDLLGLRANARASASGCVRW